MELSFKKPLKKKPESADKDGSRTPSIAGPSKVERPKRKEDMLLTERFAKWTSSDTSVAEESSLDRAAQKRHHSGSDVSSGEESLPAAPKIATARRGRPPTHGKYVGLGKARAEQAAEKRRIEEEERAAEEQRRIAKAGAKLAARSGSGSPAREMLFAEERTAADLAERLEEALDAIRRVSRVSKGLKGECQGVLKAAVASIRAVGQALMQRNNTEEVQLLQAEVARLAAENSALRRQQEASHAALQSRMDKIVAPEEAMAELVAPLRQEMAEIKRSLAVLEGKALRPPLAADRQKATAPTTQTPPQPSASYAAVAAAKAPQTEGKKRAERKKPPPVSVARPQEEGWQTAGAKKQAAKARRKKNEEAKKKKKKPAAKKLRIPRTTAVVLTLQPAAIERGTTYAGLLKEATKVIDPAKLGITSGLRLKLTQTGARLIEVPGADSAPQAEKLAASLRELLPADTVKVSRPQKNADLRISGLDDFVDPAEMIAAVAKAGDCSPDEIRCGPIRPGRSGTGAAILSCPVAAAKKVADGRRVLVGWISAQVRLLEPRPQRCYRCLGGGHVGVKCTSAVDCSGRCFRCGQPGHLAGSCEAPPHCILCAAEGKPADHQAGTKMCAAPKRQAKGRHPAEKPVAMDAAGKP